MKRRPPTGWRLAVAALAAIVAMPAAAHAQHSKLSLESIGPAGGNGTQAAELVGSQDTGKRVFMSTAEPLTAADTDSSIDIYSRTGGATTLLTTGVGGGNGAYPVNYGRARQAGTRLYFQTDERLSTSDTDSSLDVYMREGGTTTLVSTGAGSGAIGPYDALFAGASADGSRAFFMTRGAMTGTDGDNSMDVYERFAGNTTLVSTGPAGGNGTPGAELVGMSDDGTKAYFHTSESLVASDTDAVQDVYQRSGGTTTLLSTGPSGGNGNHLAVYDSNSAGGSKVYFHTAESMTSADTDGGVDVYERADASTTTILSVSPSGGNSGAFATFAGASADGSKVFIESAEKLLASPIDRDTAVDVYQFSGGTLTQLSTGGNDVVATNAYFLGASTDGSRVFFRSEEALVAGDTDKYQDIYENIGGTLTRISTGPNGGNGAAHAFFGGLSTDGTHVFFETYESLDTVDTDAKTDVYERYGGATEYVSGGVSGGNGAYDATFRSVSADGQRVFIRTAESLLAADSDLAPDVYSANVPGTITVTLDSLPNHPQDFNFEAFGLDDGFAFGPPTFGPTPFDLDDDADPTLANQHVFMGVTPGVGYSVTHDPVPGWDETAATCDNGSTPSAIDVAAGQEVNCTFTEQKRGQIIVVLDAQPNDAQDFSFTAGGGVSPASFSLDDDGDGTLSQIQSFANVVPGSGYSVSQSIPGGWVQGSATCSDGSAVSNINVAPGEVVTCTFTNLKRGQVVVVKDAQPNDAQNFSFTAGGGLSPASFQLDDDSDGTLSSTQTFTNVAPGTGYSVSETVPSGWDQSSAICSDGSSVSNIGVGAGEVVTCTFTNLKRGQVVIVQDSVPNDQQDFSFTAGGGLTPTSFVLDDSPGGTTPGSITFTNLQARNGYFVSQTAAAGWGLASASCSDGSPVGNIDVGPGETVTCTFVNQEHGSLTIVKDAQPNDAQDFTFTTSGGLSPSSFSLDDDSNGTLSNTRAFADIAAGTYSVSENSIPSGWDLSSATCSDGSSVSNISIAPAESVTCTFTNQKRAQITVLKDAQPNNAQDFSFTAGGGLSPSSFALDDDADGTLSNSRVFSNLLPASGYSLAETVPGGWAQTSATCSDGSPVSNISLTPGEAVQCTFVNQLRGSITVVKDATPDDPQDFSFTAGGGLSPSSFSLDDDADGTLSNTRSYTNLVPGSGYSLSEAVPGGWDQTSATCDDGSPISNINIGSGENVTCTFNNRKRGQIAVVKNSTPDDPQDFSFNAGGGLSPSSFSLDDDADGTLSNTRTFANVVPGSGFSLSEAVPTGWDQTSATCDDGSPVSNINVAAGEVVTCTFANRKRASLTVVKDAQPSDAQDFSFTAGGGLSPASFSLDDDADGTLSNTRTFANVVPGSGFSLSEAVPPPWSQIGASCDDGSPLSNITLSPGEQVTCTFTNRKPGNIVVVKNSTPNDAQDFDFTAGGGLSPASFALDDDTNPTLPNSQTFSNVTPGSGYSVSETVPAGWDQISGTCDDGSPASDIDVSPGETVTCTFLNRKRGRVIVHKQAAPSDGQDFSFTAGGGLSPAGFVLDVDSDPTHSDTKSFENVVVGTYSIAETVPGGWEQTGATCDDGSPVSAIVVNAGETVNCTFVNSKLGQIVAVKDATPDDPQDFDFTAGGGLSPTSFQLDDDSNGTLSDTRTFANVSAGAGYSLAETIPTGWDQTSATCDDSSSVSNIDVAPGETVTCTFSNHKRASLTIVKDAVPNDPQDFVFTAGGGLSPSSFSLDDDSDGTLSNTRTFSNVVPGSGYSVAETVPTPWSQIGASCDDSSPVGSITLSAGEHVTCTFTNERPGTVVVVQNSTPNDAQDFDFTAGGGLSPTSFSLDDDSNPTLPNSRTFSDVPPAGGYSLAQDVPTGWDLITATCDDGSPVTNLSVSPGETVTCTFLNRKRGRIVVDKDATPSDPQDFSFAAGGGLSPANFVLDVDSDPTHVDTQSFEHLPLGTYSITETVPSGWEQTGATCDDGSPVSAIVVNAGETVTCTFQNSKLGQIVAVKDATPNDPQDFSFTAGGGLSPSSFALDDDSNGTLSNSRAFANVSAGAGYSLAETIPTGWDQTSATCDDGSPVSNIDVAPGEIVTCTFTNERRATLVVVKDATPDDPQDFDFTAGGGLSPSSFSLDDDSNGTLSDTHTYGAVVPGSGYSLAEAVPTGWDQTAATCDDGSPVGNVTLSPGETVTCTFANRKRGSVVVVENATPDAAQDFDFTAGGGLSPSSFSLDDDADGTLSNTRTFDGVVPGSGYSLAQTAPSGWDLESAVCDDGSPASNISVAAGETVTCTFNHEQQGSITVVKDAVPDDGQDFSFTAGGGLSPSSFSLDDDTDGTLSNTHTFTGVPAQAGYSVSESATSGWSPESATCDDGSPLSNVDVGPGEDVTCTFTNRKHGDIVVVQDTQPDNAQDFSFTAGGGLSPASFQLDDDANPTLSNTRTFSNVAPQSGYSIAQSLPAGWHLNGATCDDGSPISNIDVSPGETVTCTFENDQRGRIIVVKDAVPDDPQDFSFTATGLSPSSFQLDDDSDGTLSNSRTFDDVSLGSGHAVSESVPAGWNQASATCSDGSPVSNIDVAAGETVTCTFLNQRPYPRPRGATPLKLALVPAYATCSAPNRVHGPSLEFPSCNPPAMTSTQLTIGSPDANSRAANMSGVVGFEVIVGNPSTPADEADVAFVASITDVRRRPSLNDYTGELQSTVTLRVTDRLNGPSLTEVGTVSDTPMDATIPCAATSDSTIGSTCALQTSADALLPGMVTEQKRTIWQLTDVKIYDGGPDNLASTQDNTLFARQGLFVP